MRTQLPIFPVILCGGSGTRLWPLSRKALPKQFSPILMGASLFQRAVTRLNGAAFAPPLIVTGEPFRFLIRQQLSEIDLKASAILIEPEARTTAPAVLAAALHLSRADPDALMLILPADHLIPDDAAFQQVILSAADRAKAGDLVTFGIRPTRAETGYGYLELNDAESCLAHSPQSLIRFVEKPDEKTARSMIASGRYLWNAGIFLFSARYIIDAFRAHAPELLKLVGQSERAAKIDGSFKYLDAESWSPIAGISLDYAIMEKAQNLAVAPYHGRWSDLGDWKSVMQESEANAEGNVLSDGATAIDCHNTLLRTEGDRLHLVGLGLEDMIVVATADAVLVASARQSQKVGQAVAELKAKGARQAEDALRDQRPWGWFESLAQGEQFQVKRILVKPGQALSLQSHQHRAEHWIVVAGTARVTIDGEVQTLSANEAAYIPLGAIHRLENPGLIPAEIIEVQTGSYLGEDDIVRYVDNYARS